MHADELDIPSSLVRALVEEQFPEWGRLAIERVESWGTDNALYRLGSDMVARLPRREGNELPLEKEQRWLPRLAPSLPLEVPAPLASGRPGSGYPFRWAVYSWLAGEPATTDRLAAPAEAARELAAFLRALQSIDTTGAPSPGAHNVGRGQRCRDVTRPRAPRSIRCATRSTPGR
jgi:aminoglycoside phosphotransferase (APT) family kinase protein